MSPKKSSPKPNIVDFLADESMTVQEEKKEPKESKDKKKKETKPIVERPESKVDASLKWLRRLGTSDRRIDSDQTRGVGSLFSHARDKEKKCFAIGGAMTDIINSLKGQTYALAGTGFNVDGSPIHRRKGDNWEELYTEMLMYMATAEGLGCTYQGRFSALKNLPSQTETAQALLDEMSNDLRKMTLNASAFSPRHKKKLRTIDSQIKNMSLRGRLAEMQWKYQNMDEVESKAESFLRMNDNERTMYNRILEKVKIETNPKIKEALIKGTSSQLTQPQKDLLSKYPFHWPPTEAQINLMKKLKSDMEAEEAVVGGLLDERKKIVSQPLPSGMRLLASATKVNTGLDTVQKEIFGDMDAERGVMRSLLADSMKAYSDSDYLKSDTLKQLAASERAEFAKIMEILGRLRLARQDLQTETSDAVLVDKRLKTIISTGKERDIIENLIADLEEGADKEKMQSIFLETYGMMQDKVQEGNKEDIAELYGKYQKIYDFLYQTEDDVDIDDLEQEISMTDEPEVAESFVKEDIRYVPPQEDVNPKGKGKIGFGQFKGK